MGREAAFFLFPPDDDDPGDIIKVTLSDQKDFSVTTLAVSGYIKKYGAPGSTDAVSVDIGGPEDARLLLTGFSTRESSADGSIRFRWATGPKSTIVFRDLSLPKPGHAAVTFEVAPFEVNTDKVMTIKSALSTTRVRLKPGWSMYTVTLDFPEEKDPALEVFYEDSATPKSLGINEDTRELSVMWNSITLDYADQP